MPRNQVRFLSILLLIAAIQAPLNAQLTAQLTGVIRDASGAIIPAVSVTVLNEGTGIKWDAKANQDGIYTVPLLQPGSYRVSVQAQGFRAVSRAGVQLEVAQTAALDSTLDVGAASESITVTDSAPPCSTQGVTPLAAWLLRRKSKTSPYWVVTRMPW